MGVQQKKKWQKFGRAGFLSLFLVEHACADARHNPKSLMEGKSKASASFFLLGR
jgi:hypothetical protein